MRGPDGAIGYDSHRERYFFGHHIYELTVCSERHDLPLFLRLDPGNETDFTASLKALDRLRKNLRDRHPEMRIRYFIQDAGHDGELNYRYALDHGIVPVIPLAKDATICNPQRPDLCLSSRGVPLCPGGHEMAPWGSAGDKRRLFVCPVKAGVSSTACWLPRTTPSGAASPRAPWPRW